MPAKYIFRLDDATAFIDHDKWNRIEETFDEFGVLPIIAVTPDNKDPGLMYHDKDDLFWAKVKSWQAKGWSIAMHGYQHLFHHVNRNKLILPYYDRSEFAGLSFDDQCKKIKDSLRIFHQNNIEPNVWIAPAHSFDNSTLDALAKETTIKIVSDGISLLPYYHNGFYFIPQQLWSIKKKSFGVWTVCLHPDTMSNYEIDNFRRQLSRANIYKNAITINDISLSKNSKNFFDQFYSFFYWSRYRITNILRPLKHVFKDKIKN